MLADANIQAWLEVTHNDGQTIVAPYVSSTREVELQYDLKLLNTGRAGTASIAQSGTVHVPAGQPRQVSSIWVVPQPGGKCEIGLILRENGKPIGRYSLDCSLTGTGIAPR